MATVLHTELPVSRFVDHLVLRGKKARAEVSAAVLSAEASVSIDAVADVTLTLHDPRFELLRSDLFDLGGRVDFLSFRQEIVSVETGAAADNLGQVTIHAHPLAVQALKRRRGAKVMRNVSPSQFVAAECKAVGVRAVIQPSPRRKTVARDTKKATEDAGSPSSWTTFQRLATELGYVLFEANGAIFFAQPTWLAKRDASYAVTVTYATGGPNDCVGVPRFSESAETEPGVVRVSFDVTRDQLEQYSPGQRIRFRFPPYDGETFLVTALSFPIAPEGLAAVTAARPVNPKPQPPQRPGGGGSATSADTASATHKPRPSSPSSHTVTQRQGDLGDLLHAAGFRGRALDIAAGVAIAESGGFANGRYFVRARVLGDTSLVNGKWGPSVGIFQIRSLRHPYSYTGEDRLRVQSKLVRAAFNAHAAYVLSDGGQNWRPWSAYNSGAYRRYVGKTGALVKGANVTGGSSSGGGRGGVSPVHQSTSPSGRKSAGDFVAACLRQAGDRYVFGAEARLSDPNPSVFDCSELIQWAAARVGCYMPDGSSNQIAYCRQRGRGVSVARGLATRGAILWIPGHVAVSLGHHRGTIEATNRQYGVRRWSPNRSFRWQAAGLVPGMRY